MLRTKNDKTKNINGIKFSAELWNSRVKGGGLHLEEQDVKDFREDTRWPCPGGRIIAWRGRGEARKEKTRADDGPGLSLSLFLFLSSWVVSNGEAISISQLVEPVPRPGDDPRRQREFHPARILSLPPLSLSLSRLFFATLRNHRHSILRLSAGDLWRCESFDAEIGGNCFVEGDTRFPSVEIDFPLFPFSPNNLSFLFLSFL